MPYLADDQPTRQLGVPRPPLARSNSYQLRVQEKINVGLAVLAGMRLEWDEIGPAVRALLGGTANYSPLDSELPLPWLHALDVRIADLLRRSLHLGRAARTSFYLPPRMGGFDTPCAVLEFGLIPWARELAVQMSNASEWGQLARALVDTEVEAVVRNPPTAPTVATRLSKTHIQRLSSALGGYGFFFRDLAHKTHGRLMDLLAHRLLFHRRPGGGRQGPAERYLPPEPSLPWEPARHKAWATFAWGSPLEVDLLGQAATIQLTPSSPSSPTGPQESNYWSDLAEHLRPHLSSLPRRAVAVWGPDLLRDAALQARLEYHVDVAAAAVASGIFPPPEPGGALLRTEDYHRDGSCPLATLLD